MKIIYKGENVLNIPNLISFYRILVAPLILYFAVTGQESLYVIFLCISLVSDILDGNLARLMNLQSDFGAALDNLGDILTYILALLGLFVFKWADIAPHAWILWTFLAVFVLSYIVSFLRFGKIPGLHLYSAVTAGYIQGIFFFVLFVFGFFPWLYFLALGWGTIAYIEKILVLFKLDDIRIGVKGLYWMMNEQKE
ncbi:MAG: CDP-alcohol phosphatidyltransferase family protein [Saprospirales bacterium]|nr:MAG: CDP-alcohol phosphatidyltransferase family protein [Saprospirales bacterium]